jgi:hypothetical protein
LWFDGSLLVRSVEPLRLRESDFNRKQAVPQRRACAQARVEGTAALTRHGQGVKAAALAERLRPHDRQVMYETGGPSGNRLKPRDSMAEDVVGVG